MSRSYRRVGAGALGTLLAVLFTVTLASAPRAHAAGCTLAPTNGTVMRFVGARTYTLHVPAGLAGPQVPLLLSMHGASGFSAEQEFVTGWSPYADAHHFIVAYPQGVSNLWDINQNSYDVTFLRQVVADISSTWCVDPHRVFSDGHSNGAIMSMRLACDAGNVFASSVEYAGADPTSLGSPCTPSRPIAVGLFHGNSDSVAPIGLDQQARDKWLGRDTCPSSPAHSVDAYGTLDTYSPCAAGVSVSWRVLFNQNHGWPTGAAGQDQRDKMWTFLTANVLP
jgi:polyhydroxybutyrate depolymerase